MSACYLRQGSRGWKLHAHAIFDDYWMACAAHITDRKKDTPVQVDILMPLDTMVNTLYEIDWSNKEPK